MPKSARLRLRDLRKAYRLIGECRDLGHDTRAWLTHLFTGVGRLMGAPVVTGGQLEGDTPPHRRLLMIGLGWACDKERELFERWATQEDPESDIFYARLCQSKGWRLLTRYRRQVVADQEWYGSPYFNDYRKPGRIDDCLFSMYHFPDGDLIQGIGLHRAPDDAPFGDTERRLIHWLHHELAPLVGRQLATARESGIWQLPPHLRQTLECLLEGESEKTTALRLGLSRHTVHDYVKGLYRHFGVGSRAELLALWIRMASPRPRDDS
ncbi:MAG: DNA-binding response regulator [Planctomycetes bacterium]|nr:DNA-binding response regulator [Planctomycetota bacterium]